MPAKKKSRPRREFESKVSKASGKAASQGNGLINLKGLSQDVPLRNHAEQALHDYFASLNGHRPAQLYDMVLREVEEPLFKAVLDYVEGNQSRAAGILGINRGTLRKKLRQFGLSS